jgi:hypothetical protein
MWEKLGSCGKSLAHVGRAWLMWEELVLAWLLWEELLMWEELGSCEKSLAYVGYLTGFNFCLIKTRDRLHNKVVSMERI